MFEAFHVPKHLSTRSAMSATLIRRRPLNALQPLMHASVVAGVGLAHNHAIVVPCFRCVFGRGAIQAILFLGGIERAPDILALAADVEESLRAH